MRQLDLQRSLARARPSPEDLEDQAGPVEHLGVPGLFEIALLHRRQRAIHHDQVRFSALDQAGELFDLALAEKRRRPDLAHRHDPGFGHGQVDGKGETDRLVEPRGRRAQ